MLPQPAERQRGEPRAPSDAADDDAAILKPAASIDVELASGGLAAGEPGEDFVPPGDGIEADADADGVDELEPEDEPQWLGVGFDGTLAHCDTFPPPEEPGPAIPAMLRRVEDWLALGLTVKIFTWRGSTPEGIATVQAWLQAHGLPALDVTDEKDFAMVEFWDARGMQLVPNTGRSVGETLLPLPPE